MVIQHTFHQGEGSKAADGLDMKREEKGVTETRGLSNCVSNLAAPEKHWTPCKYSFLGLITIDYESVGLG